MRPFGKSPNFVFFDLSKLDASSADAFLADLAQRRGPQALESDARCHWIISLTRGLDLLSGSRAGGVFLRQRLSQGDRLLCINPTEFDWNSFFPSEGEQELKTLSALISREVFLFLENTPRRPDWTIDEKRPVFRASPEGLCVSQGETEICLPWASKEHAPHRGVWWIVPGQAMLAPLPPGPWADLPQSLGALFSNPRVKREAGSVKPSSVSPLSKRSLDQIAQLRRSTTQAPLHQGILFRSQEFPGLGTKDAVDAQEALGGIRKRSMVANMQGQTDLKELGLRVKFTAGKLIRIDDTVTGTALCRGSDSFMDWGGSRHRFAVNSAFSFEGDYSWGLRQSLVLEHQDLSEPGRAIIDYYFVEESREFFVAATVRWPRWKSVVTVNRWAPLELTLFDLPWGEPLTSRVVWPDARSQERIHRNQDAGQLTGCDFLFSAGRKSLVVGFPQNQAPRPHHLPWRLARGLGRTSLVIGPEGGIAPRRSVEFEGIEEHFSFYLTQAEGARLPFSVTRKQAVELIPPYVADLRDEQDDRANLDTLA